MDMLALLVHYVSGALGANAISGITRFMSVNPLANTLTGLVGGSLGGQITAQMSGVGFTTAGATEFLGMDVPTMVAQVAGSCLGGAGLMIAVGLVYRVFSR
ncbi:MAG: hypothetical protein AAFR04_08440 [Pseudomonadota bacterium]